MPKNYRPHVTIESVLSLYMKRKIDDTDLILLKVLGDAVCCNEDQLRRYLSSKISRSSVSKRLDKFRRYGLVERWKVRIKSEDEDEARKPPAPFVLGIAGYKLLKHYYNDEFFMDPNRWDHLGISAVQRYVAMNEIRCRLIEAKAAKAWKWNPSLTFYKNIRNPMGAAEIRTPRGNINFIMERLQMSQDFVGFMKSKLHQWTKVFEKQQNLLLDDMHELLPTVIISASTLSMGETLHTNVMLDTFPFNVWVTVEEDMESDGLENSFYRPEGKELKRIKLDFLSGSS
ncbi:hypothetical protein [Halobacillus litoralis]|uniref:hypothetical protein n=1 Tax=Halobacillus litoralis TaxID=45668 RepID=UPI001F4FD2F6|nr:hypothetical protein [Halobacillus litoralis]